MALNNVLPASVLEFVRNAGAPRAFQRFEYTAFFDTLAAAATATVELPINNDADFLCLSLELTAVQNANPETVVDPAPLTIQVNDRGTGRNFFSQATHVRNVTGSGERPYILNPYRYVRPGGALATTLTNLDGAVPLDVWVTFAGIKVFPVGTQG